MGGVYITYGLATEEALRRGVNTNSMSIVRFGWLNQPLSHDLAGEEARTLNNM